MMSLILALFLAPDGRLRPSWRFWISAVLFVVANIAAGIATRVVMGTTGWASAGAAEAVYRPLALALSLAAFCAMLRLFDRAEGNPLSAMGLGLERAWLRESLVGTALGVGMVTLAVGAIATFGHLSFRTIAAPGVVWYVLVDLWVLLTAAMLEEVAFRGYPFQRLVEGIGAAGAILLLSALFGLIHAANPHARLLGWGTFNTVFIGALLAISYLRTGGLWMPWGIHFGWNAMLGLVFGLPVSGVTQFAVVVRGTAEGPQWLTGGSYGIEASATGAVVIALGMAVLLRITPRRPSVSSPQTTPPDLPTAGSGPHPLANLPGQANH
ncbi:MAG TPA: CPBP family intramembrane glutamic endopeptidase [Terriglobales bacterium]|nr:CPBP family intramembrane glutamic endopeptidase [Terriglobales bacterium]